MHRDENSTGDMKNNVMENTDYVPVKFTSVVESGIGNEISVNFPDCIIVIDEEGFIVSSSVFDNSFSTDIITGSYAADIFGEEFRRDILKAIRKVLTDQDYYDITLSLPVNYINRVYNLRFIRSTDRNIILLIKDNTTSTRAEEALVQTDLRFRSVWENSLDGMRLIDMNGNIVAANQAYSELVGLSSDEYIGQPFTVVYGSPAEETEKALNQFRNNFAARQFNSFFETEAVFRSGKKIFLEISSIFIESSQEKALEGEVLLLSIFRDITERKKSEIALRNSELRFRSVWDNSIDGMRLTDSEGVIIAVNNAFVELTGYTKEELLGSTSTDIYEGKTEAQKQDSLKIYKEKFSERKFKTIRTSRSVFRNGIIREMEVTYSVIEYKTGEPLLLAIFHDVTERKKAEEELRKNETLAAIGRMAAYLSHEIKTPLASIRMNIDLITRDPSLNQSKQKSLSIIQKEIKRLNKLLRNVLQYSKHHELLIVSINLSAMINGIKELLEVQLNEKKIELLNNVRDVKINGDYQKLQSLFLHLVENSIEAVGSDGKIEVYAEENEEEDTTTVFVKDNGCGVGTGTRIFEPFYTTKHTGTGLGLAIAHKIMEQHNGDLSLHSSAPGETIFALRFFNYGI